MNNSVIKLGLERIRELMHSLGDPQDNLKFIHVAGTNGKGSTCSFISAMLAANGYKVGMYTSPAVEDIREQYTITRLVRCSELPDEYLCEDNNLRDEPKESESLRACVGEDKCSGQTNRIDGNNVKKKYTGISTDDAVLVSEWISDEDYAQCLAEIYAAQMGRMAEYAQGERSFDLRKADEFAESKKVDKYDAPSPFETETAIAFLYFYKEKCDYVVLETGMGGRDDATNIVTTTVLSILTSISEDHLGMIGNNITEIARTKAGIIKPGVPVVMAKGIPEVEEVIKTVCREKGSALKVVTESNDNLKPSTPGSYQRDNATLAMEAMEMLSQYDKDFSFDRNISKEAISTVVIPYRMEKIYDDPMFYLDGAHNPDAALRLRETLEEMLGIKENDEQIKSAGHTESNELTEKKDRSMNMRIIFIMGMFKDKDYRKVIRIMAPLANMIYTVQTPDSERALPSNELREAILEEYPDIPRGNVNSVTIDDAVELSFDMASRYKANGEESCIVAFGSLSYLKYIKYIMSSIQVV
ncbi:MAG: hypothetical protein IJT37_08070 [Lachnospiraceae bacterium]|nr:hypothetical protein [Lachnospiraceae bacterium]